MTYPYNLSDTDSSSPMVAPSLSIPNYGLVAPQQGGALLPQLGGSTPAVTPGGGIMDFLFGKGTKEAPGAFGSLLGGASGLASAYMGMQQYGLARDTLNQHKQEYAANYDAQRRTTNAAMADRQAARVASNPGAYQSVGAYMNKNGIA